jgi:hypothetical protein
MRFKGLSVPREFLGVKAIQHLPKCDSCMISKQQRTRFKAATPDARQHYTGEVLHGDIHIFMNCPAYNGVTMIANLTDHTSQKTLSYEIKSKAEVVGLLDTVKYDYHDKFNLHAWKVLHYDQEKGLQSAAADKWFKDHGVELKTSSTDTPELNGVAEEVNKWFGQMVTTLLHYSGRPIHFWNLAYRYANEIKSVLPFKTAQGWMSSEECLTGNVPNLSFFRTWGCKATVREPRVESRKDFHPHSIMGWFAGFADGNPFGWLVYCPELHDLVISVNVTFDEAIPDPSKEYHRVLLDNVVADNPEQLSVKELRRKYIGKTFIEEDDGELYQVMKIRRMHDGVIVADVKRSGAKTYTRAPLHVADMIRMVDHPVDQGAVVARRTLSSFTECTKQVRLATEIVLVRYSILHPWRVLHRAVTTVGCVQSRRAGFYD